MSQPSDEPQWVDLNGLQVAPLPIHKIKKRRANFRKMTAEDYNALKANIRRYGFKSLIAVQRLPNGDYELIDGHHRLQAVTELGYEVVPAALFSNLNRSEADLQMIAMNLSAQVLPDEFFNIMRDAQEGLGADLVGELTGVDPSFLNALNEQTSKLLEQPVAGVEQPPPPPPKPRASKPALPVTPRLEQLLTAARHIPQQKLQAALEAAIEALLESEANE